MGHCSLLPDAGIFQKTAPLGSDSSRISLPGTFCFKIMLRTILASKNHGLFMHFFFLISFLVGFFHSSLGPKGPFFVGPLVSHPDIMARLGPLLALAVVGCGLRALSWVPSNAPVVSRASVVSRCAQASWKGNTPRVKFTGAKVYQSCRLFIFEEKHINLWATKLN